MLSWPCCRRSSAISSKLPHLFASLKVRLAAAFAALPIMFKPTPAGERRRQIQLQSPDPQPLGGEITYTTYQTMYAKIETLRADEIYADNQFLAEASHRVNIRYLPGVTIKANHRVLFGARAFDIKAVVNLDERNVEIDLLCLELAEGAPTGR